MLFGDFNAKHSSWNCNVHNRAGNILYASQQSNDFMIFHTAEHTHYPHSGHSPSTIDLLISNVNFNFEYFTHAEQMGSDHTPTICTTNENVAQTINTKFNYGRANWRKFSSIIENNIATIATPPTLSEIDPAIESFANLMLHAQRKSIPIKMQRINKPPISPFTKEIIQFKNTLKKQWQRTSERFEKQLLKQTINKLQKKSMN